MNHFAKIIAGLCITCIFLSIACNNKKEVSPYDEILQRQPFAALTDSIKKEPQNQELYFRRAVLLNKNNFPEPALEDFRQAWQLKKDERYALGISTLLLEKQPDSAIHFLTGSLQAIPSSILLRLSLARSYDAQDKTDEALTACNDILKNNPSQVDALKLKSDLLDKKNQPAEAIHTLEQAYQLTPFDVELNYALAYKYAETKNPKVIYLCDSLINMDSLKIHAEPYYYKGIYYSNINAYPKAIDLFTQAVQHDYYFLNAYLEKGRALYELKKYNDAIAVLRLALTISTTFADAYFWTAKCQQAVGQKEEAKLNYQRAYGLDKTFTEAKDSIDNIQ